MHRLIWLLAGFTVLLFTASAHAGCGASSCSIATHVDVMGIARDSGWRLDLRYEYIDQDSPRHGTRKVAVGEIHQHHDEVFTQNRNYIASLDYRSGNAWGLSIAIPYLQREHYHIHTHHGALLDERWDIAALGDLRALLDYDNFQFGLKLPTGDTGVVNGDGDIAERSLQPGTGTTDLILGYRTSTATVFMDRPASWFLQAQLQAPLAEHGGYRGGAQYRLDGGLVLAPRTGFSPVLQVNALVKGRDRGAEAEPDDTGGESLWLSPGFSAALAPGLRLYGFVQLPLYQRVNGVQLTADWTATVGLNWQL